jgi:hypothetical protein
MRRSGQGGVSLFSGGVLLTDSSALIEKLVSLPYMKETSPWQTLLDAPS